MNFRRRQRKGPRILAALACAVLLGVGGKLWWEQTTTTVTGQVVDAETQQPVPNVEVRWEGLTTVTDAQGRYTLTGVDRDRPGAPLVFATGDHQTLQVPVGEGGQVTLQPDTATGIIQDQARRPVPNARVTAGNTTGATDEQGVFRLKGLPANPQLRVVAPGYKPVTVRPGARRQLVVSLEPFTPRGMYVGFGAVATKDIREEWLRNVERLNLNTVVLDVTSDRGQVLPGVDTDLTRQADAVLEGGDDLAAVVRDLRNRNLYVIARIVVFKDNPVSVLRPEWAIKQAANGAAYVDCEGQRWLDPFKEAVWEYKVSVAERAAELGFSEVQFDYVRFPSDCIRGQLAYSRPLSDETKRTAIEGFLKLAGQRLRDRGVAVGADVFGLVATEDDIGIGQHLESLGKYVDYLCPMVYPSTWANGAFNIDYPPADPYGVVYQSVKSAVDRLGKQGAIVRPWLQAFDDYSRQRLPYGSQQIADQIRATEAAGATGWMLWDPRGRYPLADAPQLGGG